MWVRSLGSIAKQLLTRRRRARVIGISSAGVFIQLNPVLDLALDAEPASMNRPLWVVFLSPDWMSGPLTLNLPGEAAFFEKIRPGDEIRAGPDELFWLRLNARLELGRAEIWLASPPASPGSLLAPAVRRAYLAQVVQLALADRPASGWSGLLPALAGGGSHPGPGGYLDPTGIPAQVLPAIRTIKDALNDNDSQRLAQALGSLSGLGGGLTPSGDDLTLGFLLASSRWGEILLPELDRAALAHLVEQRARQATTGLSASLIACAALGQADPRLIAALDGLMTGQPEAAECATGLAEWGHSSGLDALVGMSLVI